MRSVLLITSRTSGAWGIPKGVVERGCTAEETAKKEAWEEAGVEGYICGELGSFTHEKWGGNCRVRVFQIIFVRQCDEFPERGYRHLAWLSPDVAAAAVANAGLALLLRQISMSPRPFQPKPT